MCWTHTLKMKVYPAYSYRKWNHKTLRIRLCDLTTKTEIKLPREQIELLPCKIHNKIWSAVTSNSILCVTVRLCYNHWLPNIFICVCRNLKSIWTEATSSLNCRLSTTSWSRRWGKVSACITSTKCQVSDLVQRSLIVTLVAAG